MVCYFAVCFLVDEKRVSIVGSSVSMGFVPQVFLASEFDLQANQTSDRDFNCSVLNLIPVLAL